MADKKTDRFSDIRADRVIDDLRSQNTTICFLKSYLARLVNSLNNLWACINFDPYLLVDLIVLDLMIDSCFFVSESEEPDHDDKSLGRTGQFFIFFVKLIFYITHFNLFPHSILFDGFTYSLTMWRHLLKYFSEFIFPNFRFCLKS